jgi:alkanesulfonate monooxygenase SsuD/methylene tetrahydromethanopterin reductase-like flavin-dependent oxidoreductase (luciferase family)
MQSTGETASGPVVGLMLPTAGDVDTGRVDVSHVLDGARLAEDAGFDGVYVGDHLVHPRPFLDSVVALTAVTGVTTRVSIGTCVMLVALRPSALLARQLTTLAELAPGRLRIGVGVGGEYPAEFAVAGVPLAERGRRTEATVREVKALLSGASTTLAAADGDTVKITMTPSPAERVPFLFAGWKDVALRRAAELGDGWIGHLLAPDSFARRRARLLELRDELGRADEPFTTGMLLPVAFDQVADGAAARAARAWTRVTATADPLPDRLFVAGPPEAIVEQLHTYWEHGCTEMVLAPVDQGDGYLSQVEGLAKVLPHLRELGS